MFSVRTGVDDGVLSNNTVFCRVGLDDLELDCPHASANEESVALAHRAVGCTS